MLKKISRLKSHYIICGYGRVGEITAEQFKNAGVDFVIIETKPEHCQEIRDKQFLFLEGDATNEDLLIKAGIKSAVGLLALLSSDPENLFIVLSARELNPTLHIISRSMNVSSEHKLLQAGADSVISPFKTAGIQVADDILLATGRLSLSEAAKHQQSSQSQPKWIEIQVNSNMINQSISSLADEIGKTIIGVRRGDQDQMLPPKIPLYWQATPCLSSTHLKRMQEMRRPKKEPRKWSLLMTTLLFSGSTSDFFKKQAFTHLLLKTVKKGST